MELLGLEESFEGHVVNPLNKTITVLKLDQVTVALIEQVLSISKSRNSSTSLAACCSVLLPSEKNRPPSCLLQGQTVTVTSLRR